MISFVLGVEPEERTLHSSLDSDWIANSTGGD